jgi:hypothetical protein
VKEFAVKTRSIAPQEPDALTITSAFAQQIERPLRDRTRLFPITGIERRLSRSR